MGAPTTGVLDRVQKDLLLDGRWEPREERFGVVNPATGDELARVADASVDDALAALDACSRAGAAWAATSPRERADVLQRAHRLLLERVDQFAELITLEMGKPLAESRGEVLYAADYVRWFAEEAPRIHGEYRVAPAGDTRIVTMRQPVGPCLLITPWNFPLGMITRKVAPALAAGCTMIVKPAHETPLTCLLMGQLFVEAGVPAGVLHVLPTTRSSRMSEALLADPRLRKISFTGSTGVGSTLLKGAAQNVVRTSMELGGNAPFIVFDDADVDRAVEGAMVAKFRNGGESCVAANRILVQAGVAAEFTARLEERMRAAVAADGMDPAATVGPVISDKQRRHVDDLVRDAVGHGGDLRLGGEARAGAGFFYEPTLITGVPATARIAREEIFGPVAAVTVFEDEAEAVALANDTEFGLTAFVFTNDLNRAFRVSEALETGMVGLNRGLVSNAAAPFGGVKASGLGREGGFEGINEYLVTKYVALDAGTF
ncbi:NAD-dependent succinate-semialdehyde dehydrogenase [Propioniciclava coleopterorum]|uniref:NAD-dependent succinate-semialdehyde dehydrogenase n=1 Tax=Propioniciclava coleopterorum TaxID=2714937 RepID=A0A6G7Y2E8_9ACTN|nr:NAD-dependent succinate-semialdehyde dehydrogenase [Propioniciclava coleopterorum]QIK70985.1 NAD-dependent succinate-semialdehyde dehydrogenase [Propioniciclava coleopterorum]